MEQQLPYQGGEHQQDQFHEQHLPAPEPVTDADRIRCGITEAVRDARSIDHATARCIASQLHGGQNSPLYALASSGALVDGLREELDGWRREDTPVELEPWLDALDDYVDSRADEPGPIDGWPALWPSGPGRDREDDEPETGEEERPPYGSLACAMGRRAISTRVEAPPGEDEAGTRQELLQRINAAGVRTLGEVATVSADDQTHEPDPFSWTDAATWNPSEVARCNYEERRYPSDELDALFAEVDEQLGSVDKLGWYGLVRHEGQHGGLILIQDDQGFRHVREAPDDATLDAQWAAIQQEYETFYEQRDAYELATTEVAAVSSGHSPRIWVGSLSDYNAGRLYGAWMDATLEPDELHAAVQFMLRSSGTPGAEEWSIFDHDDFGGYEVSEWSSFATVSLIAQGIAEYGPAYAAWVNYVGDTSGELLEPERFSDHYLGEWDSLQDYVEDVLQETGFYGHLDEVLERLPEDLRHYVMVDVAGVAEEWEQGLHVVDAPGGKVWLFDTRA